MPRMAADLAAALHGRRNGRGWLARCPGHNDRSPSLSIHESDDGRTLLRCFAGCSQDRVIAALTGRGLWGGDFAPRDLTDDERRAIEAEIERNRAKRTSQAMTIWRETKCGAGSPIERYLRARAIDIPTPPTLRYRPSLKHPHTGLLLPAMVAAVQAVDRSIIAVHRTFLTADCDRKAGVSEPKLSLGPVSGAAVRLAAGGPELGIAEGIETAMSFMQMTGIPTWSALSAPGIEALILPPLPIASSVAIAADRDGSGRGEQAAETAARRWISEGRCVRIVLPPEPFKDFNDAHQAGFTRLEITA